MILLIIILFFILATYLAIRSHRKLSIGLLIATILLFFSIGTGKLPGYLLHQLQFSYNTPTSSLPWKKNNIIILLGAGLVTVPSNSSHITSIYPGILAYSRIHKTEVLYHQCKQHQANCLILVSGGDPMRTGSSEAIIYTNELVNTGIPRHDIIQESHSNNTYQNAEYSAPLLALHHADYTVLVTSGFHMKRALRYFNHFNSYPTPIIADYFPEHSDSIIPSAYHFMMMDIIFHEYIGNLQYYLYHLNH